MLTFYGIFSLSLKSKVGACEFEEKTTSPECDRRLSGVAAAPDLPYCVFALWEAILPGSRVTEKQTDVRQRKAQTAAQNPG